MSDEVELVRRAQAGEAQAFGELVLAHQQFAYNLALRGLGDPLEAEDIAQEAFVRAWQALPNFRGQAQFRTWLYRIVTNLCYNRLPRLRSELCALGEEQMQDTPGESPDLDPLTRLETQEQQAFLHQQIEALPESYRMLVMLRFQQELSYAEIAEVVSMPIGTVKTGLFRARQRLYEALRQYEQEAVWMTS
ncbi:MAG: sigma-70 family RNA polymerase sigma factor [Chloroflexota bacterium]